MYTYIVVIYVHIANKSNIKSKMSLLRCIYLTTADESDDELSTGAAVAITFGVTFIITLVVTALITCIITSLYYKYRYELKEKVKVDDDKNVNTNDPYNIKMDTNPAYATTT